MRFRFFAASLLLFAASSVNAADRTAYSHSYQFDGTCIEGDMWNQWKITGAPAIPDFVVRPFSEKPIDVLGYELVKLTHVRRRRIWRTIKYWLWGGQPPEQTSWFMIGSTLQADAMIWLGPGETRARLMWPNGASQRWPSRNDAIPVHFLRDEDGKAYAAGGQLLDLHGRCPKGDYVSIMLTIYYTLAEPEPDAADQPKM